MDITIPPQLRKRLIGLSRLQKQALLVPLDALTVAVSLWAAVGLRLSTFWPGYLFREGWWLFILLPLLGLLVFRQFGLYRMVLRSLGRHGAFRIAQASVVLTLLLAAISYFVDGLVIPRSTPLIFCMVCFLGLLGARGALRYVYNWLLQRDVQKVRVVIYGAGASGTQLLASLDAAREFEVVGFLDDDRRLWGSLLVGRKVYPPEDVDQLAARHGVTDVLLALPSVSRSRRREILAFLSERQLRVRTIPSMVELVAGFADVDRLRDVGVDELLGRDAVDPMHDLFGCVRNQSVLVTGAGGSIGSELCRQIVANGARRLVLFELSEFALYAIDSEIRSLAHGTVEIHAVLGSVLDEALLQRVLRLHEVGTVFHAAAYKHVPLVEANPTEGVRNNTFGTQALARAAAACGVHRAVLISTDKAVRPTNVMGATKRLAERTFHEQQLASPNTIFSMVRFGNVMGSSGSVIPLFEKQIAAGGPVTVTHPEVIRYFMTIPEAAQLVIQAGSMGTGGDVFLLDMGEPVSILDLARRMIHLSGRDVKDENNPEGDIEIVFTGLRPGEKLYEELLVDGTSMSTEHPKIMRAVDIGRANAPFAPVLEELREALDRFDAARIQAILTAHVEGYVPDTAQRPADAAAKPKEVAAAPR